MWLARFKPEANKLIKTCQKYVKNLVGWRRWSAFDCNRTLNNRALEYEWLLVGEAWQNAGCYRLRWTSTQPRETTNTILSVSWYRNRSWNPRAMSNATSILNRINWKRNLFLPDRPSVHAKTAFSVTENGTFYKKRTIRIWKRRLYVFVWTAKTGENDTFWKRWCYNSHISVAISSQQRFSVDSETIRKRQCRQRTFYPFSRQKRRFQIYPA